MAYPAGVQTKRLTFGRYSNALGVNVGGSVRVGFTDSMLHEPTGEVILSGLEAITIDAATGTGFFDAPVTVTPDLIARWKESSAYTNQRLMVAVSVKGYPDTVVYLDIHPDDPAVIDFDQMAKYAMPTGLEVSRAAVISVAGLTGVVGAQELAQRLDPYISGEGGSGSTGITHNQNSPSASWTVTNPYAVYPKSVTAWVGGETVYPDIEVPDVNTIVLTFATPKTGRAEIVF